MKVVFSDLDEIKRLIRRRRLMGGDRYDEVWDGVYVMSPLADNEHQELGGGLAWALKQAVDVPGTRSFPGVNVSDRPEKWKKNYRCPDVALFLPGNPAEDRRTHWLGGPDFAVEILSRRDRSRKKFDFYAKVGVRELLLVVREPWRLELYRHESGQWTRAVVDEVDGPASIRSRVLDVDFRLVRGESRPRIEITRPADGRAWLA